MDVLAISSREFVVVMLGGGWVLISMLDTGSPLLRIVAMPDALAASETVIE